MRFHYSANARSVDFTLGNYLDEDGRTLESIADVCRYGINAGRSEFSTSPSGCFRNLVCYFHPTPQFVFFPPFLFSPQVLSVRNKQTAGRKESLWAPSQFLFLFCTATANLNSQILFFFSVFCHRASPRAPPLFAHVAPCDVELQAPASQCRMRSPLSHRRCSLLLSVRSISRCDSGTKREWVASLIIIRSPTALPPHR